MRCWHHSPPGSLTISSKNCFWIPKLCVSCMAKAFRSAHTKPQEYILYTISIIHYLDHQNHTINCEILWDFFSRKLSWFVTTATPPLLKYRLCKLFPPLSSIFAIRFQHIYRYIRIYSIAKQQGQVSVTYNHILVMKVDSFSYSSQEICIVKITRWVREIKPLAFFLISLTSSCISLFCFLEYL